MSLDTINQWNSIPDNPNWQAAYAQGIKRKPQPKKRSGIAKWLPAIGATAAGIGAAPFTGGLSLAATIAALGAAGAGGSALGELGAQASNKEKVNLGKIGGQAAIGGVLSAIPLGGVGRAARAGRTAASGAVPAASRNVIKGVQTAAQDSANRISGLTPNVKLRGQVIGQRGVDKYHQFLKNEVKVKNALPQSQLRQVEAFGKQRLTDIEALTTKHNFNITQNTRKQIITSIKKPTGTNLAEHPLHGELMKDFGKVRNLKGLETFRRDVDKLKNFDRNGNVVDPAAERVAGAWRNALDKFSTTKVPALKSAKTSYAKALDSAELLSKASGKLPQNKSLLGTTIPGSGRLAQKGLAEITPKISTGAERLATGATRTVPGGVPRGVAATELIKQGVGRQFVPTDQPTEDFALDQTNELDPLSDPLAGGIDPMAEEPQEPVSLQEALMQAQSLLGPNATPASYLSYAKAIMAANKADKPNATAQKTASALTNAENVIDEIEQAYSVGGGASGALGGTIKNVAGKVRLDQNANYYNSQRKGYLSRIARAFGEVGTLSDQDIARAVNLMPDLADTPQNAARKLAGLRSLLNKARQNNSSGGNEDLVQSILQQQEQYGY